MIKDKPLTYSQWMTKHSYWGGKPAKGYYHRLYGIYVRDFQPTPKKKASD